MEYSDLSGQISDTDHSLSASVKLEKKTSCNQQPSCELISPVDNESNSNGVVKMERPLSPCEAMDTNNNNNENQSVSQSQSQTKTPKDLKSGNNSPTKYNSAANGEFKQPGGSSHKSMGITQGGLISPEFRTETPVSSSALFNVPTSALFALEGLDFNTPVGSGQATPLASARFSRKRQLSISPLSSSSIDLNSLIRTSPTSLVNYITNSRGSSAGSMGHLSPSFFSKPTRLQTPHGRPLQISLRNSGYPHPNQLESSIEQSTRSENMDLLMNIKEEHSEEFIANGQNLSSNSMQSIKMEHDIPPRRDTLHQGNTLETVREESVGAFVDSDDEGHLNDTRGYPLVDPDSEMDTKIGILDSKNKRVYYNYPSVEDPHNNQCKWGECTHQCDTLESLVQHVNNEHIYRDSRKEFVCYWNGCVREKKPFKAQYMLLVHMRRHTGEKPHKCTYDGCNKAYSRLENLKTHLRSHTGEKPYVCKYEGCSKAFSNASDCAKHMNRTHTDEKPYACPNPGCTKRYTDPSSRRKHVKNCQVNKRARTGEADAMSGGEDETEPKPTTTSSRKPKPRKPDKRKQNVPPPIPQSVNAFAPVHPQLSGGGMSLTDHGYFSGGSQSYNGSQLSYNSMQEGESEYPKQRGDEEISHILQQQRLSDSNDVTTTMQQSSIGLAMSSPAGLPSNDHISDCINPNVRASRQNGGGLQTLPAGSIQPSPPPTQLQHIHSPSYLSSTHSKYSQFPTHGNQPTSSIRTPNLMGNPATTQHNPYTNGRRTNLNGVSTNRKSPSDDSSVLSGSLRSSLMNNSLSTFSSNSSRVSSPCSTNGRGELIRPHPQFVQMNDVRYSMKQGFSPRDSYSRRHNSDTWSERSWKSSQSSRYSFSSELSDDFLENLPSSARKYGFSKVPPLPLPESMHDEFSGMDYGNGTMEEHGMMDFLPSQQIPNGDTNLFLSQIQPDNLGQSNSDPLATLPLYHLDGNTTAMDVTNVNNAFSATVQTGLFSQEAPNEEIDMIYNDLPYTASTSNMMMGDMSSFVHALSEETQYFEQMLSSRVK